MEDKEIKDLDDILDIAIESKNDVHWDSMQEYPSGILYGFDSKERDKGLEYFGKLIMVFEDLGLGTADLNSYYLTLYRNEYVKFKNKGGFKSYFENLKEQEYLKTEHNLKKEEKDKRIEEIENYQISEFQYKETIRNQEDRIRDLDEQLKVMSLLKKYWLLVLGFISFGAFLSKVLF